MGYCPPGPLSMGFPRQKSWSGLPFPSPGDLSYPGCCWWIRKGWVTDLRLTFKAYEWLYQRSFPGGSDGKESASSAGDLGSVPELGRSPGEGNATHSSMAPHSSTVAWKIPWMEEPGRLQSMGSHRVGHDWSDAATATATSILAWKIPSTEEPGRLQSMGSKRVRLDWVTNTSLLQWL